MQGVYSYSYVAVYTKKIIISYALMLAVVILNSIASSKDTSQAKTKTLKKGKIYCCQQLL